MILSCDTFVVLSLGKMGVPAAGQGVACAGHKKAQNSQKNGNRFGVRNHDSVFLVRLFVSLVPFCGQQ